MIFKALNHMTVARMGYAQLLDTAAALGCVGVELRNDLPQPLFDGMDPAQAGDMARTAGLRILALAEVKRFNDWSPTKAAEALALMKIAVACGAEAISLIPRNDNLGMGHGDRQRNLRLALHDLAPMLQDHGLVGLVEPLGFETCALRLKSEAVEAFEALNTPCFKLVHDTFHHHLGGDPALFAAHTGMVHISGVTDANVSPAQMTDAHRVLVDSADRLGNLAQISALQTAGYAGPVSFECFAPQVHALADPARAIAAAFDFIATGLTVQAA